MEERFGDYLSRNPQFAALGERFYMAADEQCVSLDHHDDWWAWWQMFCAGAGVVVECE